MDKKDTRPKFEFTDHFNEKFEKANTDIAVINMQFV